MGKYDALAALLLEAISERGDVRPDVNAIPVGISNRHLHISEADLTVLFGAGYQLTKMKELSQPGQYACKETVIIAGPKGAIEQVRILGPVRSQSQLEILQTDCYKLGITAPIRISGDLAGSPGVTLIGPKGSVIMACGVIIAQRHIHMTAPDAARLGVSDGQTVAIKINGQRGGTYDNVAIRVTATSNLECHLDTEEANAMKLSATSTITINK